MSKLSNIHVKVSSAVFSMTGPELQAKAGKSALKVSTGTDLEITNTILAVKNEHRRELMRRAVNRAKAGKPELATSATARKARATKLVAAEQQPTVDEKKAAWAKATQLCDEHNIPAFGPQGGPTPMVRKTMGLVLRTANDEAWASHWTSMQAMVTASA